MTFRRTCRVPLDCAWYAASGSRHCEILSDVQRRCFKPCKELGLLSLAQWCAFVPEKPLGRFQYCIKPFLVWSHTFGPTLRRQSASPIARYFLTMLADTPIASAISS